MVVHVSWIGFKFVVETEYIIIDLAFYVKVSVFYNLSTNILVSVEA